MTDSVFVICQVERVGRPRCSGHARTGTGTARDIRSIGDGADSQAQRIAQVRSNPQALAGRSPLCLAAEEPAVVQELRAADQYELAVGVFGLFGVTAAEIASNHLKLMWNLLP